MYKLKCQKLVIGIRKFTGGVTISIRSNQLSTKKWQCKIPMPTQSPTHLAKTAFTLFEKNYKWENDVRSLTVRAINLVEENEPIQVDLFTDTKMLEKREKLDLAIESIRARFGKDAIKHGVLCQDIKLPKNMDTGVVMPTGMVS